jgi:hypothetical protein
MLPFDFKMKLRRRHPKLEAEALVALAGTVFAAYFLVLTALNAGPLWRDEVNTANMAQMPAREMWHNLGFESFPPLWPLLLRECSLIGLGDGDANIRVLGLYVGLFVLAAFWLSAGWLGCRAPSLSLGLLAWLPAFIFITGANRAYGLASGLLLLAFGMIWRMVESPTRGRIFQAGLTCLLFAQCVYYDVIFLAAMLAGGALVTWRRRQWKTLGALAAVGAVSAGSLAVYWPVIRGGAAYAPIAGWPRFDRTLLWLKLKEAVGSRSSGEYGVLGHEIWLWVALLLGGLVVALARQRTGAKAASAWATLPTASQNQADRALFCATSMLLGVAGYLAFLLWLHFLTQKWYYVEMFCLCGISLDGMLGGGQPGLRSWGLFRILFLMAMLTWGARPAWIEAHTRRSNVDLTAAVLNQKASAEDFIVVDGAWEGITFNRYYHGAARWATVPPLDSHLVHRNDLMLEKMKEREPMIPVLQAITNTLRAGHDVWLVGEVSSPRPFPPAPQARQWTKSYLPYVFYWDAQLSATLTDHAVQRKILDIPVGQRVYRLEDVPLMRYSGYKSGEQTTGQPPL